MQKEQRKQKPSGIHANNCCKQNPPMDARTSGQKSEEKKFTQFQSIYSKIFVNYKERDSNFTMEQLGRHPGDQGYHQGDVVGRRQPHFCGNFVKKA